MPSQSDNETPSWAPRFLAKVPIGGPDECWEWQGSRHCRAGHGRLRAGGRGEPIMYAHRLAWELWVGPIPDGMLVRHTCDNPPCCNPAHLLLGTPMENTLDMVRRRRHGNEKLTPNDVRAIRAAPGGYGAIRDLATKYGVHPYHITGIRNGRYRGDVH